MKVLLVNGSPKANGNTARALAEVAEQLNGEGIDTEVFQLGAKPIRDCIGCGQCGKLGGRCTFDDDVVNELIAAAEQADGFVFGSPVYYAHPSGRILSALDRAFYAGSKAFAHKPGAAVAVARRGGTSTTFDVLNKYFTINQMPVVASTYWNNVFGRVPGDADGDAEGLATMRNIGKNMAWLLRIPTRRQITQATPRLPIHRGNSRRWPFCRCARWARLESAGSRAACRSAD